MPLKSTPWYRTIRATKSLTITEPKCTLKYFLAGKCMLSSATGLVTDEAVGRWPSAPAKPARGKLAKPASEPPRLHFQPLPSLLCVQCIPALSTSIHLASGSIQTQLHCLHLALAPAWTAGNMLQLFCVRSLEDGPYKWVWKRGSSTLQILPQILTLRVLTHPVKWQTSRSSLQGERREKWWGQGKVWLVPPSLLPAPPAVCPLTGSPVHSHPPSAPARCPILLHLPEWKQMGSWSSSLFVLLLPPRTQCNPLQHMEEMTCETANSIF